MEENKIRKEPAYSNEALISALKKRVNNDQNLNSEIMACVEPYWNKFHNVVLSTRPDEILAAWMKLGISKQLCKDDNEAAMYDLKLITSIMNPSEMADIVYFFCFAMGYFDCMKKIADDEEALIKKEERNKQPVE